MTRLAVALTLVSLPSAVAAQVAAVEMDFEEPGQMGQWLPDSDHWSVAEGVLRQYAEAFRRMMGR